MTEPILSATDRDADASARRPAVLQVLIDHSNLLLAVIGALLLLVGWEAAIDVFVLPPYVLPSPSDVWISLVSGIAVAPSSPLGYYGPFWSTISNAALGFAIALIAGMSVGAMLAEFRLLERLFMPYLFALQAIPKVAVAPLIVVWLGFGDGSKIALSASLAFFPVMVNVFAGCRAVNAEQVDLMRSLSASRLQTFLLVKLPSAAPYAFAGIDMAMIYALLGTILAEFLGAQKGMGVVIVKAQSVTDIATVFAALTILGVTGILLHLIVRLAERRLVHWNRGHRT